MCSSDPDPDNDEESDEETQGGRRKGKRAKRNEDTQDGSKGKRVKKNDYYCPPSSFTLSQKELKQLFECLLGVKTPFGYCGLIRRYLDAMKQSFSGMKSHDCHVMMTQILPVANRGIMDRSEEHTSELQSHYSIPYAVFCLKKGPWPGIGRAHV